MHWPGFGLTLSGAVHILLTRVAAEGGLPAGLTADPDAYDTWFRAKVQEALADQQPTKPHDQVMREARRLIDGSRRLTSNGSLGGRGPDGDCRLHLGRQPGRGHCPDGRNPRQG